MQKPLSQFRDTEKERIQKELLEDRKTDEDRKNKISREKELQRWQKEIDEEESKSKKSTKRDSGRVSRTTDN